MRCFFLKQVYSIYYNKTVKSQEKKLRLNRYLVIGNFVRMG